MNNTITQKGKGENTKIFINSFNFAQPNWHDIPNNFPHIDKTNLTLSEKRLLEAIIISWNYEKNRKGLLLKAVKAAALSFSLIAAITFAKKGLIQKTNTLTKSVNAATISASLKFVNRPTSGSIEEIIISTVSAVIKQR